MIQFFLDHKEDFVAIMGSLHSGIMVAYLGLKHEGGLRTVWSNILGPTISQTIKPEIKQENK